MLFNSIDFAIFLPIVFTVYWLIPRRFIQYQNLWLLIASYVFYGWWDWRFLSLLIFSSILDYTVGRQLPKTTGALRRKALMAVSLAGNLGLLGFFKYYNFFVDSFIMGFSFLGMPFNARTLNIILPVGISFYTFQTLSYTLDVYRKKFTPTRNFIAFLSYVTFFPQLVAGPIERASNLLPQFLRQREFDLEKARDGMRQMLWGLFKKVVIADSVALLVDKVISEPGAHTGSELVVAMVFFTIQVYCDFSGYSDIAIGTARLFGFSLMRNFAFPFFSRNWAELWRRWHISLTTWFRDYLYYPMGGSRSPKLSRRIFNVLTVFLVSGFWHGADWNYIFWGLLSGLLFIPLMLTHRNRQYLDTVAPGKWLPTFREFLQMSLTFILFVFTLTFFRTDNLKDSFQVLSIMFSPSLFTFPAALSGYKLVLVMIVLFLIIEWLQREKQHAMEIHNWHVIPRWASYYAIVAVILYFTYTRQEETPFIYFQF